MKLYHVITNKRHYDMTAEELQKHTNAKTHEIMGQPAETVEVFEYEPKRVYDLVERYSYLTDDNRDIETWKTVKTYKTEKAAKAIKQITGEISEIRERYETYREFKERTER